MMIAGDDSSVYAASRLIEGIDFLDSIKAAHHLPPETIEVAGRKIKCAVIRFGDQDSAHPRVRGGSPWRTKVWIDPVSLSVLKLRTANRSPFVYGSSTPPLAQALDRVTTTTYSVNEIDKSLDPSVFHFHAPPDATEVANLPSPFPATNTDPARDRLVAEKKHADAFLGKPLPTITLHDARGTPVPGTQYQGHPLLIDVWATWCAPCLAELSVLEKIRASTRNTDLAMLSIDEDSSGADAAHFLHRRGYDWPDFHYTNDLVKSLGVEGIPATILTDAEGKIVYYHSGAGDEKGLAAAIADLGEAYRKVSTE